MKRREFITLLGGAAAAWPLAAQAQQRERMPNVGVLVPFAESDRQGQARVTAFRQRMIQLGWSEGRNIQIDYRWSGGEADRARGYAAELVALAPAAIVANGTPLVAALQGVTRTIPIVFTGVSDPVDAGFIESLARPGGNITGFTTFEYAIAGKWLEILGEIVPDTRRIMVILNRRNATSIGHLRAMESAVAALRLELTAADVQGAADIEQAINGFAGGASAGVVVLPDNLTVVHHRLIIAMVAARRMPTIYPVPFFAAAGGLIAYGVDIADQFRSAAIYVDRILRGEKPSDLPVQAPTKYELVINLKTAKALGLDIPPSLLARADEVIE
jgi:putative tryptophan/tyrosine transport system substrate-binding protein